MICNIETVLDSSEEESTVCMNKSIMLEQL
jgi:hypothetical protein